MTNQEASLEKMNTYQTTINGTRYTVGLFSSEKAKETYETLVKQRIRRACEDVKADDEVKKIQAES